MTMTALLDNPVVWGLIAAALVAVILLLLRARRRRAAVLPYTHRAAVLPAPQRALLGALRHAAGDRAIVLVRVPLRQVLAPRRNLRKGRQRKALARLGERHIDFLLCSPEDTRPLVAIIPGDKSGEAARESFEEAACAAAGLGLLRLNPEQRHSPEALHDALRHWLETPTDEGETDPLLEGRREPILDLPRDPG